MQMPLCSEVLTALRGRTLSTAESLTGGGIGAALTLLLVSKPLLQKLERLQTKYGIMEI